MDLRLEPSWLRRCALTTALANPEPMRARTARHSTSLVPAAIRGFLSLPASQRKPLPRGREESLELCRLYARLLLTSAP